jgi:hypothetical protein
MLINELSQMVIYLLRLINTNHTKTVCEPHYNSVGTITDGDLLIKIDQHEPH